MTYQIKNASTAYPLVFFMADSTDHITGKTGLTCTVTLSKAGAAFASPSGAVTEIANGWYKVAGNATDTGTNGPLILHATGTGADPTDMLYEVVAYDPQDAVRLGLTALPNAAAAASGGLIINGSNAGTVTIGDGLVINRSTANSSALAITGSGTGHGISVSSGSGATGNGINIVSAATNGDAVKAAGAGSGAGYDIVGGATGPAAKYVGGATSGSGIEITTTVGDGFKITPTSGNALVLTANGASKHGALVTGGTSGTSDGIKAVAGTGGVDIRGAITGNLTGTVSLSPVNVSQWNGAAVDPLPTDAQAMAKFFSVDSTTTYASAVNGSVVKEIAANAGGSTLTNSSIAAAVRTNLTVELAHIDADISSRAASATIGTPAGASVSADIAAIAAKTGNLPADPASTTNVSAVSTKLGTPAGASVSADVAAVKVDTAAVKVKTDQLTFGATNTVNANITAVKGNAITTANKPYDGT